jgi:hypothetical protein
MNMQARNASSRTARLLAMTLAVTAAALLSGCGGGDSNSTTTKAGWQKKNADLVAAYTRDLTDAVNTLNQGQRAATTGSCTQVADDAKALQRQALPVSNKAVDAPLRKAIDTGISASDRCLKGATETGSQGASDVEEAQREFAAANQSMQDADAAIKAWT